MKGRIDNAAHDAAVAKVSKVIPYKNEILSCVEQILASGEFRSSHRCQEFLSHVVEHALSGDFEGIKERILGIRVFGRDASYDTNYDSIVRVTASDVRKRLLRYYETSAPSALRIELPSGSYIPEFHYVVGESRHLPVTAPIAMTDPTMTDPNSMSNSDAIHGIPLEVISLSPLGPPAITNPGDRSSKQANKIPQRVHAVDLGLRYILATGSLCLMFLAVGLSVGALHAKTAFHPGSYTDAQYSFYKELLGPIATDPQQETKIVLSNPLLFLYRGSGSPTPAHDVDRGERKIPIPQRLARNFPSEADERQLDLPYHYFALDATDYTGLGEAQAAFNLRKLFDALDRSAELTEGRFLNWDEARGQHLVLLGGRHMYPWTETNLSTANFQMIHNVIRNARPTSGEQPVYTQKFGGGVLVDYGLIWMSQSPSGSRVLVLAGLTSTGTAGVGEFFIDPNQMKPVFERLRAASPNGSIPANWQVLLRITARDDVPINVSFVTLRLLNANQGPSPSSPRVVH